MIVTATFSSGMTRLLKGRIVGANEALIDVSGLNSEETEVIQGELEVRLLLSHPEITAA